MFARNGKACADINAVFSSRRVSKVYKALIWGRVAEGEQRHWFQKGNRGSADSRKPTLLSAWKPHEPAPDGHWQQATLLVLKCEAFETERGGGAGGGGHCGEEEGSEAGEGVQEEGGSIGLERGGRQVSEVTVMLLTGRTHQIRLQMAALGAPLVGDERYLPVAGGANVLLMCCECVANVLRMCC